MSTLFKSHVELSKYLDGCATHNRLKGNLEQQAGAIAYHYTRMAALSADLLQLVKMREQLDVNALAASDEAIRIFAKLFRDAHLKDLGIPLEWKADNMTFRND